MEKLLWDMTTERFKLSTSMEATSNLLMLLTVMVNLGVCKSLKKKVPSLLAVTTTSSMNSTSRVRRCLERVRSGLTTCMEESHMKRTRSSLPLQLLAPLQLTNKVEESLTVPNGIT